MRSLDEFFAAAFAAAIMSSVVVFPAFPLASSSIHKNGPSPAYVQYLPPEVRAGLQRYRRGCGNTLTATSGFSRFLEVSGVRLIALHFHDLSCGARFALCRGGECLHQVYVSYGGRYRLVLDDRVAEVTLTSIDGIPGIEVEYAFGQQRSWRERGRKFVSNGVRRASRRGGGFRSPLHFSRCGE